jgi:carbonic anhydrase/acetyltransferase-like protein (isoleucine patch superfamily)
VIRSFDGAKPKLHPSVFVHDSAEIIGRVTVGRWSSLWPNAVLRGDVDAVRVGERTNIQDCVVIHCREGQPAVIGHGVTIGHSAIVHGARIGDLCLIGMGAVVMESVIGRECVIAAGAMVPKGLRIPPRSLVLGFPAKAVRRLSPAELAALKASRDSYCRLAERHRRTSRVVF